MALYPDHGFVIPCPKCGNKTEYTVPKALNSEIDVYEKQKLLNGTLFDCVCSSCGATIELNFEIVYHDVAHNVAIYMVYEDEVDGLHTALALSDQMLAKRDCEHDRNPSRSRIVTCQHQLREKAMIFDAGLDDRVVELAKIFCLADAAENIPDLHPMSIFFNIHGGEPVLEIYGEEKMVRAEIPDGLYEHLMEEFAEELEDDVHYIVDADWAMITIGIDPYEENECHCENCAPNPSSCENSTKNHRCGDCSCNSDCDHCPCDECNGADPEKHCSTCEHNCLNAQNSEDDDED